MNMLMNLGFHKSREFCDQMNSYEVLEDEPIPRGKLIHMNILLMQIGLWHPSCIAVIKKIRIDVQQYLNYCKL
jgi:hypothetical protein